MRPGMLNGEEDYQERWDSRPEFVYTFTGVILEAILAMSMEHWACLCDSLFALSAISVYITVNSRT